MVARLIASVDALATGQYFDDDADIALVIIHFGLQKVDRNVTAVLHCSGGEYFDAAARAVATLIVFVGHTTVNPDFDNLVARELNYGSGCLLAIAKGF